MCVIGGGPAGAAAAVTLCRAGCSVALATAPPRRWHGGSETLAGPGRELLIELCGSDVVSDLRLLTPVSSYASSWGSDESAVRPALVSTRDAGSHVDRALLDRVLIDAAARSGAAIVGRMRTQSRRRRGWSVECDAACVDASFIILATGRGACALPHPAPRLNAASLIACTVKIDAERGAADRSVRIYAVEQGWLYSVQPPDGPRTVTLFTSPAVIRQTGRRALALLLVHSLGQTPALADVLDGVLVPAHPTMAPAGVSMRARICSDRFTACGDAAQTLDPLSSDGIRAALTDGVAAARFITEAGTAAAAAREYDHRRRFLEHLRTRFSYYHAENRWPGSPFWASNGNPQSIKDFVSRYARLSARGAQE